MSQALSPTLVKKIAKAMQEEEIDVYTLSLFCMNADDLSFFSDEDRMRVKLIFQQLIDDTKHHTALLKLILEMGEKG